MFSLPYLDAMAQSGLGGLRMDHFYAQHSFSPTRGNVLTGRHPNRYGIFRPGFSICTEEITIGHLLQKAGYAARAATSTICIARRRQSGSAPERRDESAPDPD